MKIRLNKAHFPVTTLGPGRRIGLWVQGCHIHCPGCLSRDTWERDPAREVDLDLVLAWCRCVAPEGSDGVTISGGEPFEQPAALAALLDGLAAWRRELARPFDILCYSGFPLRDLERRHPNILTRLDAIIPEPYVDSLPRGKIWRGSTNQPLVPLSPLGRDRYSALLKAEPDSKGELQVSVEAAGVWYIGIPDRGDMARLEAATRRRGVVLGGVSWRA
jgi:anaerobic ribonucleoside-triphosphate reductase activating protein